MKCHNECLSNGENDSVPYRLPYIQENKVKCPIGAPAFFALAPQPVSPRDHSRKYKCCL